MTKLAHPEDKEGAVIAVAKGPINQILFSFDICEFPMIRGSKRRNLVGPLGVKDYGMPRVSFSCNLLGQEVASQERQFYDNRGQKVALTSGAKS